MENLNSTVEELKSYRDHMDKKMDDDYEKQIKENPSIAEIADAHPAKALFDSVTNAIIEVLNTDPIIESFQSINNKFIKLSKGELEEEDVHDISKELTILILASTTHAIYSALGHYDGELKGMLSREFAIIHDVVEKIETEALVRTMKLGELENIIKTKS